MTGTKQYIIDRLIENARKSLGQVPVKVGPVGAEVEQLVYEPAAVNAALRLAGLEIGMFKEKSELRVKTDFSDLSDELTSALPSPPLAMGGQASEKSTPRLLTIKTR